MEHRVSLQTKSHTLIIKQAIILSYVYIDCSLLDDPPHPSVFQRRPCTCKNAASVLFMADRSLTDIKYKPSRSIEVSIDAWQLVPFYARSSLTPRVLQFYTWLLYLLYMFLTIHHNVACIRVIYTLRIVRVDSFLYDAALRTCMQRYRVDTHVLQ